MSSATTTAGIGTSSTTSFPSIDFIPDPDDPEYLSTVNNLYQSAVQSLDAHTLKSLLQNPKTKHYFDEHQDKDCSYSDYHYSEVLSLAQRLYFATVEEAKKNLEQEATPWSRDIFHQRKSDTLTVMLSEWGSQNINFAGLSVLVEYFKTCNGSEEQLVTAEQLWDYVMKKQRSANGDTRNDVDNGWKGDLFSQLEMFASNDAKKLQWIKMKREQLSCE